MSAAEAGRKLQNTEDEVTTSLKAGVVTAQRDQTAAAGGTGAQQFPRDFKAGTEEWDRVQALRQQLVTDPANAMTPFGQLQFSDRDAYALLKKQQALKEADFDSWFAEQYHVNDLPTRQFAQEINPGFYAAREAKMVERAKMALRIKLIELRGPRDEKDLQIVYGLKTGEIRLDPGWDQIGYTPDEFNRGENTGRLRRDLGLASRMFVTPATATNPFDPRNENFQGVAANPFYTAPSPTGVATGVRNAGMLGLF